MSIIKTENLCFSYDEGREVLKNINIEINEGEFVAVLGHNGSGKSTFAKHLNAILLPTSGKVFVDGMDTSDEEKLGDIRKTAGMVFQNPDNQIIATVVEEDVAFALEHMGVEPNEMRQRVDEALEMVGMSEFSKHATHQLSGGQKQRIAISGVFAMKPRIIILDEPTAMLDPKGRASVMKILHELNENGITIVLITHYMDEAAQASRVIVINEGEVLLDDEPHYVFQNAGLLSSIGLDVPPSTSLMFKLRESGFRVPLAVLTDEECVPVIEDLINNKY
ncbi:MAG: energy-coupling factor transporter ATPase [Clostridia bacterium]|nr:energy-coupling factor transporter ATPase [Clostridia bacterium]